MTKKIIAALLAAVMMLSLFAGCGNGAAPSASPEVSNQNTVVSETDVNENAPSAAQCKEPKIELSGNAEDKFIAEEDCYAESERVVMFIQKGCEVRGDMLKLTEMAMDDITAVTGLPFERNYNDGLTDDVSYYFGEGAFEGINRNNEKVYVILAILTDSIQSASESGVVLESNDYVYEESAYQVLYHELAHVNHLMNGTNLGSTLTEGFAVYASEKALMSRKLPLWNQYQYYFPYGFDESVIAKGEAGFSYSFESKDDNYHYGFRFIHFLEDTYGEECFYNILGKATKDGFTAAYTIDGPENQEEIQNADLINIIKSQTDADVFEKFAKWNQTNWENMAKVFDDYNVSVGSESIMG